jgi:tRNA G10  N-methylase Trm11
MRDTPTIRRPASVWLTGQLCSRDQRRGRYTRASIAHPGKMLPAIAARAIATWSRPGEIVLDPMAGIGTTIVEAMHAGRTGIGVEYESRWSRLAADNIALATQQGAIGVGQVWCGDSRQLTAFVPADIHGHVSLILTSPPYGAHTHGHVRIPRTTTGKVTKSDHRYGTDPTNLAHADDPEQLAEGFTQILAESALLLKPGGVVAITARPVRRGRELLDIPGLVITAATRSGLRLTDRCVALIPAVRNGALITRASFFQKQNVRQAHAAGDPQWLIAHEDLLVFSSPLDCGSWGMRAEEQPR